MTTTDPLRFDGPTLARAWLSVAQASVGDANAPSLDKTVALETYPNGVRLVATDRYVILTAWAPALGAEYDDEPGVADAPDRTVVTQDLDGLGRDLLKYVVKRARRDKLDTMDLGALPVELEFDVRLPIEVGQDQPLEGLEPAYALLTIPDVTQVHLPIIVSDYLDWRPLVHDFTPVESARIGLPSSGSTASPASARGTRARSGGGSAATTGSRSSSSPRPSTRTATRTSPASSCPPGGSSSARRSPTRPTTTSSSPTRTRATPTASSRPR